MVTLSGSWFIPSLTPKLMLVPLYNSASLSPGKSFCHSTFKILGVTRSLCSAWNSMLRDADMVRSFTRTVRTLVLKRQWNLLKIAKELQFCTFLSSGFVLFGKKKKKSGLFPSKSGKKLLEKCPAVLQLPWICRLTHKACYKCICLVPVPDLCCNKKATGWGPRTSVCLELLGWSCSYHSLA